MLIKYSATFRGNLGRPRVSGVMLLQSYEVSIVHSPVGWKCGTQVCYLASSVLSLAIHTQPYGEFVSHLTSDSFISRCFGAQIFVSHAIHYAWQKLGSGVAAVLCGLAWRIVAGFMIRALPHMQGVRLQADCTLHTAWSRACAI